MLCLKGSKGGRDVVSLLELSCTADKIPQHRILPTTARPQKPKEEKGFEGFYLYLFLFIILEGYKSLYKHE